MSESVAAQAIDAAKTANKAEDARVRKDETSRPTWEAATIGVFHTSSGDDGTIQSRRMSEVLARLSPSRGVNHLLQCQRYGGNAAVQRLIAQLERFTPEPAGLIQRDPDGSGGAPGGGDGSGGHEGAAPQGLRRVGANLPALGLCWPLQRNCCATGESGPRISRMRSVIEMSDPSTLNYC